MILLRKRTDQRGRVTRVSKRDPWFDMDFRGALFDMGEWIDLRSHSKTPEVMERRAIPPGYGVCTWCFGWRPIASGTACEDPPQHEVEGAPDDSLSCWYESDCYFGETREPLPTFDFSSPQEAELYLYWCTTSDHDEDWFVIASSRGEAARYHADYEGYNRSDAKAKRVAEIPPAWIVHGVGHPDLRTRVLEDCGGVRVPYQPDPRLAVLREQVGVLEEAWSFNGKIYVAGDIIGNIVAGMANEKEIS